MFDHNQQESIELSRKQIRKIASGLRCTLGIQEGVELVYMIGEGYEDNNSQALESWNSKQLTVLSPTNSDGLFEHLKQRLTQTLNIEEFNQ